MLPIKNYLKLAMGALFFHLALLVFQHHLLAQTYFPLGIFNYDIGGAEHRLSQPNEPDLIKNINATSLTGTSFRAQNDLVVFSDTLHSRVCRTILLHDSLCIPHNYYYYLEHPVQDHSNTQLSRYISDNQVTSDIYYDHIRQFIINVDSVYDMPDGSHPGVGTIMVAHQGWMDSTSHWPFIKYACDSIQHYFGDRIKSAVIHNIFHWIHHSSLRDFFNYMTTLDVYQHEEYPFHVHNAGADPLHPTACAPFCGGDYQDWYIDSLILGSYDQTRNALIAGQGQNHHTRLEVIIQTQREYYPATQTFVRRPTESEIWLQAFLALSRGYRGVHSYVYRTTHTGNSWGLIDERTPRQQHIDSLCFYENYVNNYNRNPYSVVTQLYDHLAELGDDILPLTVLDAFTWTGTPHSYITDIIDDVYDGGHGTIEISLMDDPTPGNNYDYFLLINRRCFSDNNGTPAALLTITVYAYESGSLSSVIFS